MNRFAIVFLAVVLATSCAKQEKDETEPVMEAIHLNKKEFVPLEVVEVHVQLADDENLNQVRSKISQAFAKSFHDWSQAVVKPISGKKYEGVLTFVVPDTAKAGYYQLATQAMDMSGNTTVDSILYFTVLQPGFAPEFHNFQTQPPVVGDVIYLSGQDTLTFSGTVTDELGLKSVSINLKSTDDKNIRTLNYNLPDSVSTWDFAAEADTIFPNYDALLPAKLIVKAVDGDGNQSRLEFEIDFEP